MSYVIRTPINTWKSVRWHLTAGFPLAGQRVGIKTLWGSEIEKFPMKVSEIRFPNMKQLGDITKIKGAEIEIVDIICGGSPCQGLSVAGLRKGLEDERSGLFMEQVRIVREMRNADKANNRTNEFIRPRFMVWENVPGAFSSNKGEDFRAVLEETAKIADETVVISRPTNRGGKWSTVGCIMGNGWSIAWRILDAQYWGVPQRRRRIFLVADFGGQSAPEILFKSEGLRRHIEKGKEERKGIATDVEGSVNKAIVYDGYGHDNWRHCEQIGTLTTENNHVRGGNPLVQQSAGFNGYKSISGSIQYQEECAPTLESNMPSNVVCLQGSMIGREDKNGPQGNGINEDVSFTLNATDRHAVVYGICSDGSNSMKSDNPHSGIYEADTTRTLDQNGGNPACNQGGMAIVQNTYQKVTGPLMANSHPGSYCGQDAYTDMLVAQPYTQKRFGEYENKIGTITANPNNAKTGETLIVAGCDFRNDKENGDLCGTLQAKANGGQSLNCIHPVRVGYAVRRLTPLECERLQDFPDGWTDVHWVVEKMKKNGKLSRRSFVASDSQRYKACGNSVAVCCPEYVLEGIKEILQEVKL